MTEHLLTDDIKNYLSREMSSVELSKADEHLAKCDACFTRLTEFRDTVQSFDIDALRFSAEESEHLSYERLEAYVDQKANEIDREIADVHLQVCRDCSFQLDGLLQMRKLVEADSEKREAARQASAKSIFGGIREFLSGNHSLKYGFAALAVLLVVSFFGIFIATRRTATNEIAATASPTVNAPQNVQSANVISITDTPANADSQTNTNVNANVKREVNTNTSLAKPPTEISAPENVSPKNEPEIAHVISAQRLNLPAELKTLNSQTGRLMGGEAEGIPFAVSDPVGKIVQTNRPQFQWRELAGAEGYVVNVYDTDFNLVATSPQISATSWQVGKPLARGKTYLWQVTAIKNGEEIKSPVRPAPDARFKVLDANKAAEIARLNRQYKNEHLFLGIMYANAGLLDEAEREFRRELAVNPNSKQARKFLQNVRAGRK